MIFLAGDVGGTKVLLQLISFDPDTLNMTPLGQERYLCQDFDTFESIVKTFLSSFDVISSSVESACFGLPGPVDGRVVQLTNLPWIIDAKQIERACNIQNVTFVNDFYAAALGVEMLTERDIYPLYIPEHITQKESLSGQGHRLVVGAGTGLGVAPVFYDGECYMPISSEGGHFDFAPISETQQHLLSWLWKQWEHVSYERVLSGPGLETLYRFFQTFDIPTTYSDENLLEINKNKHFSTQNVLMGSFIADMLLEPKQDSLNAAEIYHAAEHGDAVAVKALTEFVTIYGAFVGAVALVWNAPQGVYLAGGIAEKLIHWMEKPFFQKAFLEKGRMSQVVANMPVYVVTDDSLGLRGAMHYNLIVWQARKESNLTLLHLSV